MGRPRKINPIPSPSTPTPTPAKQTTPPLPSTSSPNSRPVLQSVMSLFKVKASPNSNSVAETKDSSSNSQYIVKLKVPSMPVEGDTLITNLAYESEFGDPEPILSSASGLDFAPLNKRDSNTDGTVKFNGQENESPSTPDTLRAYRLVVDKTKNHVFTDLADFEKGYPSKTNICCWWCAYPFDSRPVGVPKVFHEKTKTYYCTGCFCSFQCALSYTQRRNLSSTLLRQMYYNTYESCDRTDVGPMLVPAPDPSLLDIFGGSLNIEEFRMKSATKTVIRSFDYPQVPWPCYKEESYQNFLGDSPKNNTSVSRIGRAGPTKINVPKVRSTPLSIALPR
jgi:hypothetical protein